MYSSASWVPESVQNIHLCYYFSIHRLQHYWTHIFSEIKFTQYMVVGTVDIQERGGSSETFWNIQSCTLHNFQNCWIPIIVTKFKTSFWMLSLLQKSDFFLSRQKHIAVEFSKLPMGNYSVHLINLNRILYALSVFENPTMFPYAVFII